MSKKSTKPSSAAIIGQGVIGGGWAARFLLSGWDVRLYDRDPASRENIYVMLENAKRSLSALYDAQLPREGELTFADSLPEACDGVQWVQESVPEIIGVKEQVLREVLSCSGDAIIASSTSGFRPSQLQFDDKLDDKADGKAEGKADGKLQAGSNQNPSVQNPSVQNPSVQDTSVQNGRVIVAHPFSPVYLIPLVEVVTTKDASDDYVNRAVEILTSIGMKPVRVRAEIDGHIADRLLEALWREALWMIADDQATTSEIDDVIRYGFGLRWAQMGLFENYRIAGGAKGMRRFLEQFGPALKYPWSKLTDVPEMDEALIEKIASQSEDADISVRELERQRDDNLVAILRALRQQKAGAGQLIEDYEKRFLS